VTEGRFAHKLVIGVGAVIRRSAAGRTILDLRLAVRQRWFDVKLARRDRRRLLELADRDEDKLNIGSSTVYLEGWVNIDITRDPRGRILKLDATKPWPLPSDSIAAVNSEHFIEHVSREGAEAYLREAFRVLRPGAPIRTSTPDLEGICAAYRNRDPADLEEHRRHGYDAETHADLVNNYFYSFEHRYLYDFTTLEQILRRVGFRQITRTGFGVSDHTVMRGVDRHSLGSLQDLVLSVDAVKPTSEPGVEK
jgi:predicted SAM-dependent methyltransferase